MLHRLRVSHLIGLQRFMLLVLLSESQLQSLSPRIYPVGLAVYNYTSLRCRFQSR